MRTLNILLPAALALTIAASAHASTVNLTFDEDGNISLLLNGNAVTGATHTNTQFDTMGTTLEYTLPTGYSFPLNSANGQGRSELIFTDPVTNKVSDVAIFLGNEIFVFDGWAGHDSSNSTRSNNLLAFQYFTTQQFQLPSGPNIVLPGSEDTVSVLESDLQKQNLANTIWFSTGAVVAGEQADPASGVNSYTYSVTPSEGYAGSLSLTGNTISETTVTFVDGNSRTTEPIHNFAVAVPLPASSGMGGAVLALLGLGKLWRFLKRQPA